MSQFRIERQGEWFRVLNQYDEEVKSLYTMEDAVDWVDYLLLRENGNNPTVPSVKQFLTE